MRKKRDMYVAMIGHKRIPSREGGVEIVVCELATRMVKEGINVTCYNRRGKHVLDKKKITNKLKEYKARELIRTINPKKSFTSTELIFSNYDIKNN